MQINTASVLQNTGIVHHVVKFGEDILILGICLGAVGGLIVGIILTKIVGGSRRRRRDRRMAQRAGQSSSFGS
jgi:hypothetical protein